MRILKVTQTYFPYLSKGGPPVKISGIARELARRGNQVTVLTACLPDEADVPLNAPTAMSSSGSWMSHDRGVETVYLPSVFNYRATTINPRVLNFCRRRLSEFDVVHIYGLYDSLGWAVARACRRQNIPYVLEPLGMFGAKIRSQRKKRVYQKLIGNKLFRRARRIIATSETEREELIAGGVEPEKIVLRRNGVDLSEFRQLPERGGFRSKLGISADQFLFLFLGRLSFIKGLDVLVEAYGNLENDCGLRIADCESDDGLACRYSELPLDPQSATRNPQSFPHAIRNPQSFLVLAGVDDGDGCSQRIAQLVRELKLEGRVIQHAPIYGDDKLQALVDADVLVLSSRYESFGNAAAEAIAAGTPVLVTKECGIASLVEGAGLVVSSDVLSLRDGLQALLGRPELLSEMRKRCAIVAGGLSWDAPVDVMERVYGSVLDGVVGEEHAVGKGAS